MGNELNSDTLSRVMRRSAEAGVSIGFCSSLSRVSSVVTRNRDAAMLVTVRSVLLRLRITFLLSSQRYFMRAVRESTHMNKTEQKAEVKSQCRITNDEALMTKEI